MTIEDVAELRLAQPHVIRLEARPASVEGRGEVTIRALVRNALRMRPDRIVVGEVRGAEALDMLSAMSTGHDGSLCTVHAGSPEEALRRVETLALMADVGLPHAAIREQVAGRARSRRAPVAHARRLAPRGVRRGGRPRRRWCRHARAVHDATGAGRCGRSQRCAQRWAGRAAGRRSLSGAALMAAAAAACGVAAAWELLLVVEGAAPRRLIAPLVAAGRSGPSSAERRRLAVVAAASLLAAGWIVARPGAGHGARARQPRRLSARRSRGGAGAGGASWQPAPASRLVRWPTRWRAGTPCAARSARPASGLPGAVGEELREAARALALGERTDAVLDALRTRARDPSWDAIVAAIALQRTSGGDLARLLRDLAVAIDERARSDADARAATAQARMTAWIVAALPAGAALLAQLADPGALSTLTATGPSTALAVAALVCELSGVLVVRAIVSRAGRP